MIDEILFPIDFYHLCSIAGDWDCRSLSVRTGVWWFSRSFGYGFVQIVCGFWWFLLFCCFCWKCVYSTLHYTHNPIVEIVAKVERWSKCIKISSNTPHLDGTNINECCIFRLYAVLSPCCVLLSLRFRQFDCVCTCYEIWCFCSILSGFKFQSIRKN